MVWSMTNGRLDGHFQVILQAAGRQADQTRDNIGTGTGSGPVKQLRPYTQHTRLLSEMGKRWRIEAY